MTQTTCKSCNAPLSTRTSNALYKGMEMKGVIIIPAKHKDFCEVIHKHQEIMKQLSTRGKKPRKSRAKVKVNK